MKKRWGISFVCMFLLIAVTAFIVKLPKEEDKPKVVVVLKELNTQYWNIVKAGAEKGFREFGIDGKIIATRNAMSEEQNEILQDILAEKPDVLIVSPLLSSNIPILKKFEEHNIPVLLLDTDDPWENKTSYIGTDNFELGRKAGELLASQLLPGEEVALIAEELTNASSVMTERIDGAIFSLEDAGMKIVVERVEPPIEPADGKAAMIAILEKYPDVKGVFAPTDLMALSAQEVIEKRGVNMSVIGADGIVEMVELIEEGTLVSTVAQNPYDMGYISVETAARVIKGEKVAKTIDTGVDIITKDNAELKLGFLKELLK